MVERDDRDRRRERACGLIEIGEGDGANVVAVGLRVDRKDVVADRAERPGEATRARADLEDARGRLGQVAADEDLRSAEAIARSIAVLRSFTVSRMRMRAAVLEEFGKPLVVQEVELAEPAPARCWSGSLPAASATPTSTPHPGADPSGYSPTVLGHEGAGVVERSGDGVGSRRAGRPRRHALLAAVPRVRPLPRARGRTSAWRSASSRTRASCPTGRRGSRATASRSATSWARSTFAEYTVMPEIALAKVDPEAPFEHACLFACGLSTGLGAAMFTAKVEAGSTCVVFGAGMVGLGAVAGCRLQRAERIISSTSPRSGSSWRAGRGRPTR